MKTRKKSKTKPLLTNEEVLVLFREKNKDANQEIYKNFSGMIFEIARKFSDKNNIEDLTQEGAIGLLKSIEGFDENKNACFATYAHKTIRGYIMNFVARKNNVILTPYIENRKPAPKKKMQTIEKTPEIAFSRYTEEKLGTSKELQEKIKKIKSFCTAKERRTVDYFLQGMSCLEIARITKITPQAVSLQIKRLKEKIGCEII